MKNKLQNIGSWILILVVLLAFLLLINLVVNGGVWVSVKVYPLLRVIMNFTLALTILILVPLSLIRRMRPMVGSCMLIASYVFGITLWMWSLLLTYAAWGWAAIFIGLILMGIGVVPIAMLASIIKGIWPIFFQLIILVVLTYGTRLFGIYLISCCDHQESYYPVEN